MADWVIEFVDSEIAALPALENKCTTMRTDFFGRWRTRYVGTYCYFILIWNYAIQDVDADSYEKLEAQNKLKDQTLSVILGANAHFAAMIEQILFMEEYQGS